MSASWVWSTSVLLSQFQHQLSVNWRSAQFSWWHQHQLRVSLIGVEWIIFGSSESIPLYSVGSSRIFFLAIAVVSRRSMISVLSARRVNYVGIGKESGQGCGHVQSQWFEWLTTSGLVVGVGMLGEFTTISKSWNQSGGGVKWLTTRKKLIDNLIVECEDHGIQDDGDDTGEDDVCLHWGR